MLSDFAIFKKRETKDKKSVIWYVMGPFLLLLTLSIVLIYSEKIPLFLILACAGGIIFSNLFQIYGAIFSSALILYLQSSQPQEFTSILITASILLSFMIMALSAQELRKFGAVLDEQAFSLSGVEVQATSSEEATVSTGTLAHVQQEEIPQSIENRDIELQYKQLRKQFEEKTEILKITRRQLFETENALLTKEREIQEIQRIEIQERKEFEKLLREVQASKEHIEAELLSSENFITKILSESNSKSGGN